MSRPLLATFGLSMFFGLAMTGCGQNAGGVNIWKAIEQADGADIETFAKSGGNLDVKSLDGSTPLWVALSEKNRYIYEALLKHGADPNVIMSGKRVVTHWAASEEDSWWLRLALEHGADPNLVNIGRGRPSEGTPLQFVLGNGKDADSEGALKNIELLVKHGADVNKPDRYNSYPLSEAAAQNDFEIVLYLLNQGADYNRSQSSGIMFLTRMRRKLESKEHYPPEYRDGIDAVCAWLKADGVDVGDAEKKED